MDLGKSTDVSEAKMASVDTKKKYYPTLFISDVEGLDEVPSGDITFTATGKVISKTEKVSNGKTTYSCEIEVHDIECENCEDATDSLGKTLDKKEKQKMMDDPEEMDEEE